VANRNQMAVHNIWLHESKGHLIVDLHLEVDDHLSLQQAHEMASHFERDLRADMPEIAFINTHIESRGTSVGDGRIVTDRESQLVKKIKAITDEVAGGPSCHDVMLRRQAGRLSVALHCIFDEKMSIIQVHDITTRIELRLKSEIPALERIIIHAEPAGN
jgi:divalent metal cation (Fe/Co/Zn/Cd) transporter